MRAGGAELGCLQVAEALIKAGHRALIASEGGRMVPLLEAVGATHIRMPLATKNPARLWLNARTLARIIRKEHVDIIHARSRAPAWSALWASRRTNIAFVTTYHSEYAETGRIKSFYNGVMAKSDRVIAVSDHMSGLIQLRYGTDPKRIRTIHRAYDPVRFDKASVTPERIKAIHKVFGTQSGDTIVLLAGRITRRKAQAHLVEAVGLLKQRGIQHFNVVFAGEVEKRDYMGELLAMARRYGIENRLRFPGNVADMPAAYMVSDVLINISEAEGLPRVAIEAQAMGVPVIVSDTGPGREVALTPPDVPLAEATGLRVPYAAPEALAGALAEFLGWPAEQRRKMGERAQALITCRYSLTRMTGDTLCVYQDVLKERSDSKNPKNSR